VTKAKISELSAQLQKRVEASKHCCKLAGVESSFADTFLDCAKRGLAVVAALSIQLLFNSPAWTTETAESVKVQNSMEQKLMKNLEVNERFIRTQQLVLPKASMDELEMKLKICRGDHHEGDCGSGAGAGPAAAAPAPVAATPASAPAPAPTANSNDMFVKASPLAKKLANEKGIDLNTVNGSGDNGRIVKADIDNYRAPGANSFKAIPAGQESYTEVAVSQMRKTIARRLAESKFSAPHFYLTMEINMDNVVRSRKAINAAQDVKVSFNDFVVKATAMSLKKHPAINSAWLGDRIRYNDHVHIGIAGAVEDGVLVPVVRFADTKSLPQISVEVKEYAQKAKDKKLQPADWEGNTFSISNLGMYGIEQFTAIVNPPDACIMAIGGIVEKPIVKDGQIVPGHTMKVTLSCDHRVVDGATGAEFLNTFKAMLEEPVLMMA
jgi:pyruvate dehydrogenase E2 component (dihydrolipoamide acetyltransferase)